MKRKVTTFLVLLLLTGCAGFNRGCSSFNAQAFGSDWIVLQYGFDGKPINCWQLKNTSISNEEHSDGIYWLDSHSGHLVHISGWYNRVQVAQGRYDEAAKAIGVDLGKCVGGKYGQ